MEIQNILGYMLNTSARFIKRKMDKSLENYDLTTSQWAVIKLLSQKDRLTQAQIANELKADKATVGTVISNLHKKEYIDKKIDKNDKRAYMISLTDKAKNAVREINSIAEMTTQEATSGIDADNIEVFYEVLGQIIDNLMKGEEDNDMETRGV